MSSFVSYSQQKCFPGRKMKIFSTICISKPPENDIFWIIFCLWVHCIITAVLQVASKRQPGRKYPSKADTILVQLQKSSEISLLTLFMCYIWSAHWRWLALYCVPFRLCHTITALTVLISVFTMVFSGQKQILLFGNTCFHFLSFSFCHMLVMSSFKNCLENGNRLVIACIKQNKTKTNSELHLWRSFFPSCLLLWVLIPYPWKAMRRLPLTSAEPKRLQRKVYWENFWWYFWCRRQEVQELVTLQTLAMVSSNTHLPQGLYLPKVPHTLNIHSWAVIDSEVWCHPPVF